MEIRGRDGYAHYMDGTATSYGGPERIDSSTFDADALLRHLTPAQLRNLSADAGQDLIYLLLFSGASRGNLGPGGAGQYTCGSDQLGIQYGFQPCANDRSRGFISGLFNGPRQAKVRAFVPLYVVGENKAIINQLRVRWSPVRPRLSNPYREAREIADALSAISWSHYSHEHNLMAAGAATATAANVEALGRRTLQTGPFSCSVRASMDPDINDWYEMSLPAELEIQLGSPAPLARRAPPTNSPEQHASALHGGTRDETLTLKRRSH
uniref:RNase H type-1 domain-containing protein n=1 Tax=Peronospora matthiolae TaxID=2874970 RepID=A0AAV1V2M2_9STRA